MERVKTYLTLFLLILSFLGYSYYNYNKRAKAIKTVEVFQQHQNFKRIWHLKEGHFNIFDRILGEKNQYDFIFISPGTSFYSNDNKYWVHACSWSDPLNAKEIYYYTIKRDSNLIKVWYNDLFWVPQDSDVLIIDEIKGTEIERVDNWIKKEGKKELLPYIE